MFSFHKQFDYIFETSNDSLKKINFKNDFKKIVHRSFKEVSANSKGDTSLSSLFHYEMEILTNTVYTMQLETIIVLILADKGLSPELVESVSIVVFFENGKTTQRVFNDKR